MTENSVLHDVCVYGDIYRKVIEPIGAIGAADPDFTPPPQADSTAHWVSEACNHLPASIFELTAERDGWTPNAWHDRLLQLADACADQHPDRAAELRRAASLMRDPTEAKESSDG
jgi:hypothetical protein